MNVYRPINLSLDQPNFVQGLEMPDDANRSRLPTDAQRVLDGIEEQHGRCDAAVEAANAAQVAAHNDWARIKTDLAHLESRSVLPNSGITQAELDGARARLDRARKVKDVNDEKPTVALRERAVVRQVASNVTRLINATRTYAPAGDKAGPLNTITGRGEFSGFDLRFAPPVKLSGDPKDIVAKQRRLISGLLAERKAIEAAPLPRESVEARLLANLDKAAARATLGVDLGERGRRDSNAIARFGVDFDERSARDPSIYWPVKGNDGVFRNEGGKLSMHLDAEAFIARFFREELVAEIRERLDHAYADVAMALDPGEANVRLRDIKTALIEAERIECAAIRKLIESGDTSIFFRADCSARAILGVE